MNLFDLGGQYLRVGKVCRVMLYLSYHRLFSVLLPLINNLALLTFCDL